LVTFVAMRLYLVLFTTTTNDDIFFHHGLDFSTFCITE